MHKVDLLLEASVRNQGRLSRGGESLAAAYNLIPIWFLRGGTGQGGLASVPELVLLWEESCVSEKGLATGPSGHRPGVVAASGCTIVMATPGGSSLGCPSSPPGLAGG